MILVRPLAGDGGATYRYVVELGGETSELYFASLDGSGLRGHDALVASALMPAMALGEDLRIDAGVSADLLHHLPELQDILTRWIPSLERIEVHAEPQASPIRPSARGSALFFTGGVDSFYALIQNRERLDALIFVHGFDIPLESRVKREVVARRLRDVADAEGLELIEIESDLRRLSRGRIQWGLYFGCGLAAVGHLLSDRFDKVMFASGLDPSPRYGITPWSQDLRATSLWSSADVAIDIDPLVDRPDKIIAIADDPIVQRHLRVCWRETDDYNCGRCEKCLRTSLVLDALGVLDRYSVFPRRPSFVRLATVDLTHPVPASRASARSGIAFLKERGLRPHWRFALHLALLRGSLTEILQRLKGLLSKRLRTRWSS